HVFYGGGGGRRDRSMDGARPIDERGRECGLLARRYPIDELIPVHHPRRNTELTACAGPRAEPGGRGAVCWAQHNEVSRYRLKARHWELPSPPTSSNNSGREIREAYDRAPS